jgi:hypothetical protein
MRIARYFIGAAVVILISAAACMSSNAPAAPPPSSASSATPPSSATPTPAALALATLPPGIVGHYAPAGAPAGDLPTGAPYQIIGRYGAGWLLLRLPDHGEFWTPAAALAGIDLSAIPDYAEGSTS